MSYLSIDEIIKQLAETNPNVSEEEGLKEKLREDFEELEQNYKLKDDSKTIKEKLHSFKEKHPERIARTLMMPSIGGLALAAVGYMVAMQAGMSRSRLDLMKDDIVDVDDNGKKIERSGSISGNRWFKQHYKQIDPYYEIDNQRFRQYEFEENKTEQTYCYYDNRTRHMIEQDNSIRRLRDKNYLGTNISTIDIKNALSDYAKTQEWD